jgi:hypothetical protein
MKIYPLEKEAGLESQIIDIKNANASLNILSSQGNAEYAATAAFNPKPMDSSNKEWIAKGLSRDVMWIRANLVSTTWNKNDDVFTIEDTWKARYTAMYKPLNMGHLGRESAGANTTFGVITNTYACDDDMKYIWDIPKEGFNIGIEGLIWARYFPSQAAEIKENIDNGIQSISMECNMGDFGYALKPQDEPDTILLMPRHEITAWMTKSLRIFGGTGEIEINAKKYKVGRWLRDIIFTGGGFTLQPADPNAKVPEYIMPDAKASIKQKVIKLSDFSQASVLNIANKGKYTLWPIQ